MPGDEQAERRQRGSAGDQSRAQRHGQPSGAQRVADAAHGVDQRRAVRVELLAQIADVGLEHARVAAEVVVPDVVEDLARVSTRRGLSIR